MDETYRTVAERVKAEDTEIHRGEETAVVTADARGRAEGSNTGDDGGR